MEEGGSTSDESGTTVEMLNNHNHNHNPNQLNLDVGIEGSDDSELDLGLGLGLSLGGVVGSRNLKLTPRNFAPNDLPSLLSRPLVAPPSSTSSGNDNNSTVGTKRAASPTGPSQAVGWPPVKTYRMNSMANQAKPIAAEEHNGEFEENKGEDMIYGINEKGNAKSKDRMPAKRSLFVKVRMDGDPIGRKVDLSVHPSYVSLAQTLEEMFINTTVEKSNGSELALMPKASRPSKLLDGSSEHVLTYEDKDGDWMLVGDVPWGMFMSSVKKLRITRTSEANGLDKSTFLFFFLIKTDTIHMLRWMYE